MEAWTVGDPNDPDTQLGPMAEERLRDDLHDQVERSVSAGARVVSHGQFRLSDGAHVEIRKSEAGAASRPAS